MRKLPRTRIRLPRLKFKEPMVTVPELRQVLQRLMQVRLSQDWTGVDGVISDLGTLVQTACARAVSP